MDPTEITQKVKARFDHELARRILKEKYQTKQAGIFRTNNIR